MQRTNALHAIQKSMHEKNFMIVQHMQRLYDNITGSFVHCNSTFDVIGSLLDVYCKKFVCVLLCQYGIVFFLEFYKCCVIHY